MCLMVDARWITVYLMVDVWRIQSLSWWISLRYMLVDNGGSVVDLMLIAGGTMADPMLFDGGSVVDLMLIVGGTTVDPMLINGG